MTAQNSNIVNAFETTLSAQLASGGTIMVLADDPGITSPAYFVVDPDSDSAREVIEWTAGAYNNATVSRDLDSKHGTDPTHASGTKVRLAVVKQHITDTHERIDDIAVTGAVTGTIDAATQDIDTTLASGIDATKIADGTVSDAEFQYLNGVTSAIQTQLDGKQATGSYITADSADTLTNKTIDADGTGNSISNIEDANIKASAAIDATKIADGSVTSAEFQYIGGLTSDAQTQLDAKLALSGGTMTGEIDLESFTETYNAGGTGSSFTVNMDNGSVHLINADANCTVNFTNVPSGVTKTMFIRDASSTAGYTFTWQVDGVTITPKFLGGTAHESTANYDLITFLSIGNGEYYISAQTDWS